ncbi:hypothetical protein TELCIR_11459 [Teladorsagia circumcincta]|uniref:Carboxylesterase type B domain-containing protein n=1 Tax=Teladorsagia circumcincta TaxID=45464 RepID=A0A2G9U9E3_TELCI|nr:hypothetical protein TELCIR_11459 [Teladorsagia circumcincta]
MSGSPWAAWALGPNVPTNSLKLAEALECSDDLKSCMKQKTVEEVYDAVEKVGQLNCSRFHGYTTSGLDCVKWGPVIDGEFLQDPDEMAASAPPKDSIVGISDKEAAFFTIKARSPFINDFGVEMDEFQTWDREKLIATIKKMIRPEFLTNNWAKMINDVVAYYVDRDEEDAYDFYLERYTEVKEMASLDALVKWMMDFRMRFSGVVIVRLELVEVPLTDGFLSSILSWLVDTGCQLEKLWITRTSMAQVTSSMFLHFIREAALSGTGFCSLSDCSLNNFSPEVLHFVVTRQLVVMGPFCKSFIPICDDILDKLTATKFFIDAPNMITVNGLKSLVERLSCGKQKVRCGLIRTNFSLDEMSFSLAANANLRIALGKNYIIFSSMEEDIERLRLFNIQRLFPL